LLQDTNRLGEAEPLYRRALAIGERSLGPDHPKVATDLNNLASLLRATNRLGEAEPLYRRALAIFLKFTQATGHQHPHLQVAGNNYSVLLAAMGQSSEQIRERLDAIGRPFGIALGGGGSGRDRGDAGAGGLRRADESAGENGPARPAPGVLRAWLGRLFSRG
jgi:hypothetical protein